MSARHLSRLVLVGAVGWLFVAALLLLQVWPRVPQGFAGWMVFIALGPPSYVLAAAFAGWLFSERHGAAISRARFSPLRVLFALFVSLAFLAVYWWVLSLMSVG
jgi:hypothetical protein